MTFFSLLMLRLKKLRIILLQPKLRSAFFEYRVMAGVEHKPVLSRPLATVVDIGANRGQFALAARAISGAKVVSFEPLPEVALLYRDILFDDAAVTLHVAAIGEKSEKKQIHLSARDDSSSLLEIGSAQSEYFPGTQEVGTIEVEVGTLDQYLSKDEIVRPAMLKLDVQGYEMQALAGCRSLIGNFDYIYCECSFVELYKNQKLAGEVIGYLNSLGFGLAGIYNPSYDRNGNCIQADLLFEKAVR
ncbi:MAG: FkbM family methyltransferase [Proteobacteria bacterium]|nr:FkbM family methyltransferase [Sideroxydans sp.]MBU4154380.1 FkbM family methyltransferase [Pseudomonadota bacterium]